MNLLASQYEDRNTPGDFIQHIENASEVDGVNSEAEILGNQENTTIFLPLNMNITQDPDVWARASNIGEYVVSSHRVYSIPGSTITIISDPSFTNP